MAGWIAVLVDNKELVRFVPLREGESGVLNLTTMLPDQAQAYVEIYFVRGALQEHVHTFHARGIRTGEPRPQIVVSGHVRGDATVTLRVDGELISTTTIPIQEEMQRPRTLPWIVAAAAVVIALAVGAGIWWAASGRAFGREADAPPTASREQPTRSREQSGTADDQTDTVSEPADQGSSEPEGATGTSSPDPEPPARIGLDLTLYFLPEQATLIPATRSELDATAEAINEWVAAGGDAARLTVELVGHTALYGTQASRLELSRERSRVAASYLRTELEERGITGVGLRSEGRGGREPVTRDESEEWRNRRVELTLGLR